MSPSTILSLQDVSTGYEKKRDILSHVNLTISEHDFLGIIGPNGGGKTTLIKLIMGLLRPRQGEVKYFRNGARCKELRTGYLPQYNHLDSKFPITAHEVILSGLNREKSIWKPFSKEQKKRVCEVEEYLELTALAESPLGTLSGGQMQRVLLARAIVSRPELLVLDEPNTYIDAHFQARLYSLLEEMNHHCAIVLVSHDLGTVLQNVRNVACVNGEVCYHPVDEINEKELVQSLGCPFDLIAHGSLPHRILKDHTST